MRLKDKRSLRIFAALAALLVIYLALKYAASLVLPFAVAFVGGRGVYRLAERSAARWHGAVRGWSRFYVIAIGIVAVAGTAFAVQRLVLEAGEFFAYIGENVEGISRKVGDFFAMVGELPSKLPIFHSEGMLGDLGEKLGSWVQKLISSGFEKGSAAVGAAVGKLLLGTPSFAMSVFVSIIAWVYVSLDYKKIRDYLFGLLPAEQRKGAGKLFCKIKSGIGAYYKVYFKLFLLTFGELLAGLLLLRVPYAFFVALLLALLDLLPLFGAAAVLGIWAAVLLIGGSYARGGGMLVLVAVMVVVRQIAEPKLVGRGLGLHPLAALASIYVGVRLLGFLGVIFGPVAVIILKEILEGEETAKKSSNFNMSAKKIE